MLATVFTLILPQGASAAGVDDANAYLEANRRDFERQLEDYNRDHRVVENSNMQWVLRIFDWTVLAVEGDRAFANVKFQVGRDNASPAFGAALFEIALSAEGPKVLSHRPYREPAPEAASAETLSASQTPAEPQTAAAPHSDADAERYFNDRIRDLQKNLSAYNKRAGIAVHRDSHWEAKIIRWHIESVEGNRVFAAINFEVGRWGPQPGSALFELQWRGDNLEIVGHGAMPKSVASGSQVLGYDDDAGCVYNYYAARPCLDTMRRWRDFTEFHGLEMTPETAVIFQAYKHNDVATGDRLMAQARGLPAPDGDSAFGLQREVTALKLGRYRRNLENPCDLNPYGTRPCPEIFKHYRDFIARHDLPDDKRSAAMLEAYSNGDFRQADVAYALAKGLDVPAYGYIPTGLAREVATLNLSRYQNFNNPCDLSPYGARPCLEVLQLWQDFAARYALEDSADNARIFAAYAEGDYRVADQLFAQAKGVSLEQLHEAAGVPTKGLVIEVYPGRKQLLLRGITGS